MLLQLTSLNSHFIAAEKKLPEPALLILVHGRGGKWKLMEWFSKRLKNSGLDFLLLEAPFAEDVKEMKQPGFSWYLMPEFQGLEESREKIQLSLEEILKAGYSSQRVFWLGFSQGGIMGLDTALRQNFLFGGVFCISGVCIKYKEYPESLGPFAKQQRLIATHGRRDEILDFEKAVMTYEHLKKIGVSLDFREFNKRHSFDLREEIPFLEKQLLSWIETE